MREDSGFAKRTCQYRIAAVELAVAEPEESPENSDHMVAVLENPPVEIFN